MVEIRLILNISAVVLSSFASGYLFLTANRCTKGLKNGFNLLGVGILIGLTLHAIAESLTTLGILGEIAENTAMPIFIALGSALITYGTYVLYETVRSVESGESSE